ncbi:MAG: hypothetical protein EHM46_04265, partial [Bacteroidetes bacterium]
MRTVVFLILFSGIWARAQETSLFHTGSDTGIPGFIPVIIDPDGPEWPWGKCTGDLDNDGWMDLIIGGFRSGGLVYYVNPCRNLIPESSWDRVVISEEPGFSTDIEVSDIDGDGNLDLFCVRSNSIEWFSNPGWNSVVIDSIEGHDLEIADFDNDRKSDLVVRNQGEFGKKGDVLFFYRQVSPGSWEGTRIPCPDGEGLKVCDLDRDGRPDVIVNGSWFRNTGNMDQWEEHSFAGDRGFRNSYIDAGDI